MLVYERLSFLGRGKGGLFHYCLPGWRAQVNEVQHGKKSKFRHPVVATESPAHRILCGLIGGLHTQIKIGESPSELSLKPVPLKMRLYTYSAIGRIRPRVIFSHFLTLLKCWLWCFPELGQISPAGQEKLHCHLPKEDKTASQDKGDVCHVSSQSMSKQNGGLETH